MSMQRNSVIFGGLLLVAAAFAAGVSAAPRNATMQSGPYWTPLRYFEGVWNGAGDGIGGRSKVDRAYRFVLDGHFLHMTTKAVFPKQEKNPEGAVHQDWGMISYDAGREKFVLREFHSEKYVNTYVAELSEDGRTIVFTTEHIENIPKGWRARVTMKILDPEHFEEIFELAPVDQDFFRCSTNTFERKVTTRE